MQLLARFRRGLTGKPTGASARSEAGHTLGAVTRRVLPRGRLHAALFAEAGIGLPAALAPAFGWLRSPIACLPYACVLRAAPSCDGTSTRAARPVRARSSA